MANDAPTIFLSAAEASGDEHAARLIAALRDRLGEARFVGVGGTRMGEAGCEILADSARRASMLAGPLLRLPYYVGLVRRARRAIRRIRPDLHIPVDSPALNWHLASASKDAGIPVLYYIAPQVWAWAPWRVRKLARLTDAVACILPFEQEYLRSRGVNATYVGHPLFDSLPPRPEPLPDLLDAWWSGRWSIALLPGSRAGEIHQHAPGLRATAEAICGAWPRARCTFTARTPEDAETLRKLCGGNLPERPADGGAAESPDRPGLGVTVGRTREVLAHSHFAVAVSGTVTLETAHFGVPMVILYRSGPVLRGLRALAGRWVLRTRWLSLVNILAGQCIVPELMPWNGSPRPLVRTVLEVLRDVGWLIQTRQRLLDTLAPLECPPGRTASDEAARLAVDMLGNPTVEERSGARTAR